MNTTNGINDNYSTKRISPILWEQLEDALRKVENFGSVEIYIQNGIVTQISTRLIKKTKAFTSAS